jgi:hypothetical protein
VELVMRATVVILATLLAGCASFFLKGATLHAGAPPAYVARFAIPTCTTVATSAQMAGPPGQTYYLVDEPRGLMLYELDLGGSGAAIYNGWSDETAIHFFAWVRSGPGWLYTFPRDRKQLPTRSSYVAGGYTTHEDAKQVVHPAGQPTAICPMVPQ